MGAGGGLFGRHVPWLVQPNPEVHFKSRKQLNQYYPYKRYNVLGLVKTFCQPLKSLFLSYLPEPARNRPRDPLTYPFRKTLGETPQKHPKPYRKPSQTPS